VALPVAVTLAAFSVLGLLLQGFGELRQLNGPLIALLLPVHIGVVGALYHTTGVVSSPAEDDTGRIAAAAAA
jgi:hypothetical protein